MDKEALSKLIDDLDKLGFYKYTQPEKIKDVKKEAVKAEYLWGWRDTQRDHLADAESLAEGGVKFFFEKLSPFLNLLGVTIESIEDEFDFIMGGGYTIKVNGIAYELYSEKERGSADCWDLTSRRAFAIVNTLLARAGSDERIYQVSKWNDCQAIVLTKEMYDRILSARLLTENETPILIDEWRA